MLFGFIWWVLKAIMNNNAYMESQFGGDAGVSSFIVDYIIFVILVVIYGKPIWSLVQHIDMEVGANWQSHD